MDKGFVGGTEDGTGLTHLGAREYDPATGRFISVDPVLDENDPQQLHGYSYANNAPVTASDPDGLFPDISLVGPLAGALAEGVEWVKDGLGTARALEPGLGDAVEKGTDPNTQYGGSEAGFKAVGGFLYEYSDKISFGLGAVGTGLGMFPETQSAAMGFNLASLGFAIAAAYKECSESGIADGTITIDCGLAIAQVAFQLAGVACPECKSVAAVNGFFFIYTKYFTLAAIIYKRKTGEDLKIGVLLDMLLGDQTWWRDTTADRGGMAATARGGLGKARGTAGIRTPTAVGRPQTPTGPVKRSLGGHTRRGSGQVSRSSGTFKRQPASGSNRRPGSGQRGRQPSGQPGRGYGGRGYGGIVSKGSGGMFHNRHGR
ncbi:RHS repeat-associated protein [Hamadaea flava]|nr:RHS repeat-associated core domain-containing protein [Hamadaea flava]MCP2323531.1 RHS repeat-associated protein [Hamadaea flava]